MTTGAWLCLFAPLAGALAIALAGTRIPRAAAGWISTLSVFVAFAGAVWSFLGLRSHGSQHGVVSTAWTWLESGTFKAGLSVLVDPLSTMMMLIVSGVGGLIVLYSIGYMDGDDEERRYFAYMSLFVFSMLLLVEGGNLLLLLAGWGLVGLSSYLLIGFWHEKPSAVAAAKKAFVMNAFGDATMALAFFVLIFHSHSLSYAASFATAGHLSSTTVSLVALGLLGGAAAKSAQIPLHTWLPDAMEGPTPVSALIHAATMVTAGVYLIARTHPIFEQARTVELVAAGMGALTLLVAGLVALVQTDIKRVIAYSTMSQIGYMFMGAGVGAYANGMFHLMTHAFFKALLFMGAGLVIHALAGEQDIRKMGGIGKLMPWTRWMFLAASLALVGIFPFAGFFSKDSIIAATLNVGWYGYVFWAAGLAGAFLTGLYTFRLYFIVFAGETTAFAREHHHDHHGHEGPRTMLVPVAVLTVLSTIGGWIQFGSYWHPLTSWLAPAAHTLGVAEPTSTQEWVTTGLALGLGLAGIAVAYVLYGLRVVAAPRMPALQRALEHKLYFDEAYALVFYKPAVALATQLRRLVEEPFVLAAGPDFGEVTMDAARLVRRLQTGMLRTYVLFLGTGMAIVAVVFLVVR
ncbi:MAG TPA: NADH-quinone oxidoreductase subunit L [Gaiellaceae bacterium]|nr:NADH-quinone oxidoreductase subunit L [Gaiellaceae bacterium]